jgi:hypothetical protein
MPTDSGRPRVVLKWPVLVNDLEQMIGGGPVAHVECQANPNTVMVWTIELADQDAAEIQMRWVQVYGTGQPVPPGSSHLGSCLTLSGTLVWHVFSHSAVDWDRY